MIIGYRLGFLAGIASWLAVALQASAQAQPAFPSASEIMVQLHSLAPVAMVGGSFGVAGGLMIAFRKAETVGRSLVRAFLGLFGGICSSMLLYSYVSTNPAAVIAGSLVVGMLTLPLMDKFENDPESVPVLGPWLKKRKGKPGDDEPPAPPAIVEKGANA